MSSKELVHFIGYLYMDIELFIMFLLSFQCPQGVILWFFYPFLSPFLTHLFSLVKKNEATNRFIDFINFFQKIRFLFCWGVCVWTFVSIACMFYGMYVVYRERTTLG